MSCPCQSNKISTTLRCVQCNRVLIIKHGKNQDPLIIAQRTNKRCTKCGGKKFKLDE
jgi:hypothetical protein